MVVVTYQVVRHENGWAYKVGGAFSETFATEEEALSAAQRAATRQQMAGPTETISYEDERGVWHKEVAAGDDRPYTEVKPGPHGETE